MLKKIIRKKLLDQRKKKYSKKYKIKFAELIKILKKNSKNEIGGYFPVKHEIDCIEILELLEKKKFKISLPKIKQNNEMEFYRWLKKDPMILNKYGIPETISTKIIYPDIIIVPIVAFDKYKYRIGYGGGYYDRYIEKIQKKKKILTIGFAFSFQQIKKVPKNNYDKNLDIIITEKTVLK